MASARFIFGEALGDPTADTILANLRAHPEGMTRTEIHGLFGRNRSAHEIDRGLSALVENGLASRSTRPGEGRPAECWVAPAGGGACGVADPGEEGGAP